MARWTAAAVVAYYAKRYHIEKGILWGFMANLYGIGIGEKTKMDALDKYEFSTVVHDYLENSGEVSA